MHLLLIAWGSLVVPWPRSKVNYYELMWNLLKHPHGNTGDVFTILPCDMKKIFGMKLNFCVLSKLYAVLILGWIVEGNWKIIPGREKTWNDLASRNVNEGTVSMLNLRQHCHSWLPWSEVGWIAGAAPESCFHMRCQLRFPQPSIFSAPVLPSARCHL